MSIPLSVVVLSQNEEDNIERCLKSVQWCDDIVLIDNSQDQTLKVARKVIPAKQLSIISSSESDNFAQLRNLGLTKVKHEWVLFLDADEEVSKELHDEITVVLDSSLPRSNNSVGYVVKRNDFFLEKWLQHGETGNIELLKLGKKSAGKWERTVHETWKLNGPIGELTSPLLHYPHPTVAEFLERVNRWSTLDAQEFFRAGKRYSWFHILAYPSGKFLVNYIIKLGFLDGMPGLIMALMMSFHSFLTRAKAYQLQQSAKQGKMGGNA